VTQAEPASLIAVSELQAGGEGAEGAIKDGDVGGGGGGSGPAQGPLAVDHRESGRLAVSENREGKAMHQGLLVEIRARHIGDVDFGDKASCQSRKLLILYSPTGWDQQNPGSTFPRPSGSWRRRRLLNSRPGIEAHPRANRFGQAAGPALDQLPPTGPVSCAGDV